MSVSTKLWLRLSHLSKSIVTIAILRRPSRLLTAIPPPGVWMCWVGGVWGPQCETHSATWLKKAPRYIFITTPILPLIIFAFGPQKKFSGFGRNKIHTTLSGEILTVWDLFSCICETTSITGELRHLSRSSYSYPKIRFKPVNEIDFCWVTCQPFQ